jgi:hypothetical protein
LTSFTCSLVALYPLCVQDSLPYVLRLAFGGQTQVNTFCETSGGTTLPPQVTRVFTRGYGAVISLNNISYNNAPEGLPTSHCVSSPPPLTTISTSQHKTLPHSPTEAISSVSYNVSRRSSSGNSHDTSSEIPKPNIAVDTASLERQNSENYIEWNSGVTKGSSGQQNQFDPKLKTPEQSTNVPSSDQREEKCSKWPPSPESATQQSLQHSMPSNITLQYLVQHPNNSDVATPPESTLSKESGPMSSRPMSSDPVSSSAHQQVQQPQPSESTLRYSTPGLPSRLLSNSSDLDTQSLSGMPKTN